MTTKTNLTVEQQRVVRQCLEQVVSDKTKWESDTTRNRVGVALWGLLGYKVMEDGSLVPKGTEVKLSWADMLSGDPYRNYKEDPDAETQEED